MIRLSRRTDTCGGSMLSYAICACMQKLGEGVAEARRRASFIVERPPASRVFGRHESSSTTVPNNFEPGVRACYDEGKRVAETLFFDFHRQHKIEVRVARIFNTFGPGMHPYGACVRSASPILQQKIVLEASNAGEGICNRFRLQ